MQHAHFSMYSRWPEAIALLLYFQKRLRIKHSLCTSSINKLRKSFVVTVLLLIIDIPAVQDYFCTERHTVT